MSELRQTVVSEARKWLGTPYHHAARIRGVGVDCAMLLCEVYAAVGLIPHTDPGPYPAQWHLHRSEERFLGWIEKFGKRIDVKDVGPGDVLLYQFARCASHGAIVTTWPNIIHAHMKARRVEECGAFDGDLYNRLHSAWTFEAYHA